MAITRAQKRAQLRSNDSTESAQDADNLPTQAMSSYQAVGQEQTPLPILHRPARKRAIRGSIFIQSGSNGNDTATQATSGHRSGEQAQNVRQALTRPGNLMEAVTDGEEVSALDISNEQSGEAEQTSFPFMKLPGELRNMVYEELLVEEGHVDLPYFYYVSDSVGRVRQTPPQPELLKVSRLVRTEALAVFYGSNVFAFDQYNIRSVRTYPRSYVPFCPLLYAAFRPPWTTSPHRISISKGSSHVICPYDLVLQLKHDISRQLRENQIRRRDPAITSPIRTPHADLIIELIQQREIMVRVNVQGETHAIEARILKEVQGQCMDRIKEKIKAFDDKPLHGGDLLEAYKAILYFGQEMMWRNALNACQSETREMWKQQIQYFKTQLADYPFAAPDELAWKIGRVHGHYGPFGGFSSELFTDPALDFYRKPEPEEWNRILAKYRIEA